MIHLLFTFAVAIALSTTIAAAPPIALQIRVQSGGAPFTTRARITLDPHADNRYLCLSWTQVQGGSQQRTSCFSLDGETAPKTHWQFLKDLSSGRWTVVAYVIRNDEQAKLSNPITLHVLGPNYESESEP